MSDKIADSRIVLDVGPGAHAGEYIVKVVRAATGGQPRSTFTLDVDALADTSRSLETTVLASAARARRRMVPELEKPLRQVGSQLFKALFAGPVDTAYRSSLAVASQHGEKLRVVLSITAPELAVMPWEALYDDELETYVCLKDDVVRHVDAPYTPDPLPVSPPLRILAIVASPRGLAELNVDAEKLHLENALAGPISSGQAQLDWETQASYWRVHERLLREQWHVLHFIGHGDYDPERGEGRIALVRDDGRPDWVDATKLADLLGEAEPTPRVVVLNSCASGQSGSNDLFSGTAATLVRRGISAVAAMQFSVSDTAAVAFPRGFYTALASGRRVDEAVRAGRIDIRGIGDGTLEWVTPILHVRGDATELFQLVGAAPPPAPSVAAPAEQRRNLMADPQWPEAVNAYWAKRWREAVEHFEALQARYPDESRVQTRLQEARRHRDIEFWLAEADAGTQEADWDTVVTALERLIELDPAHPDAAGRLDHARHAQRCRSLVDEMTTLHEAGQWDAVVAAAQELVRLDPENPDPDGMVSDAQAMIREAHLAERYAEALNHLDEEDWRQAADLFAAIDQERPGYRDATTLRATAEQQLERLNLADKYGRATKAQTASDWKTAATLFGEITAIDADYRDAATRRQQCETARRIADLQTELRHLADDGAWHAVIQVGAELADLDATAADTDALIKRAREMLGTNPQQRRPDIAAADRPVNEPEPASLLSKPRTNTEQAPAPTHGHSLPPAEGDDQTGYPLTGPGIGALPKQAYTPWIKRVGAWIIDAIPLLVLILIDNEGGRGYVSTVLIPAYLIWNYGYRQGTTGSSIGKSVMKFAVVSVKTGHPIGFGMSIVRQLAHTVDWIIFCIGCLSPLWDDKRQTVADKIMSTVCLPIKAIPATRTA
jgi:hypothetical protein